MSTDPHKLPDICRRKHGGNAESEEANERIHSRKEGYRIMILAYADVMGSYGVTVKEVCKALDMKHQTASARLSEMRGVELEATGKRRDRAGVLRIRRSGQLSLLD